MKRIFSIAVLALCLSAVSAFAAVRTEDFSCRGVVLGEHLEGHEKLMGRRLFDNDRSVFGQRIKYITYRNGYVVGVDKDDIVVDIVVTDHDYTARDGVRYGATLSKIHRVFGDCPREVIEGQTWHIFANPDRPEQRLMLEIDTDTRSLYSWRITSLPLTFEEAEQREKHDDEWQSNELNAIIMNQRQASARPMIKWGYKK